MDKIKGIEVSVLFSSKEMRRGVEKYAELLQWFPRTNVETDSAFQRKFNGFYRVRRNVEWQKIYYALMESGKTKSLDFEKVIRAIYKETGRVEASFASKLIHTLDNDKPIWDKFVLQNLGLKMPVCYGEKKLESAIRLYRALVAWYEKALELPEVAQKIVEFDQAFKEYKSFSSTKKLDFLLWQIR